MRQVSDRLPCLETGYLVISDRLRQTGQLVVSCNFTQIGYLLVRQVVEAVIGWQAAVVGGDS